QHPQTRHLRRARARDDGALWGRAVATGGNRPVAPAFLPLSLPKSIRCYNTALMIRRSRWLCVLRTDNGPRVRDGYISESMCGHARALATYYERPICRTNVLANDRTHAGDALKLPW